MILVTGGCGFIGTNFIKKFLTEYPDIELLNIDKLSYASILDTSEINHRNYIFEKGDISDASFLDMIFKKYKISGIFNFAAESHVDQSIFHPRKFIESNILGTFNLLEKSLEIFEENENFKFLHVSTDEVFGSLNLNEDPFDELSRYKPNSPYSASKASSDHIVNSFNKTFNLPTLVTNCSNNFGPYQHKEKLIPKTIQCILERKNIPIYGNGKQIRDWLYVNDHCEAILKVFFNGKLGETYNIGGSNEIKNIELVKKICRLMNDLLSLEINSESLISYVNDRPGHDTRYAINSAKIQDNLKWQPSSNFDDNLLDTIKWYIK